MVKSHPLYRPFFILLGLVFVVLGLLGAFLPVLPTTPFLIVALWCFAHSSDKLHRWLYNHRIFGPLLRQWHEHSVIPPIAKFSAVTAMTGSMVYMVFFSSAPWGALVAIGGLFAASAWYILSKPSHL